MGPIRLIFVTLWTLLFILPHWGENAVYIVLAGHIGLRIATAILAYPVYAIGDKQGFFALRLLLSLVGTAYLMWMSVHFFSWGCFFAILLTFCSLEVKSK